MRQATLVALVAALITLSGCSGGECEDADGDGYGDGEGCEAADCDDSDPRHYTDCLSCSDPDDDGRGVGCNLGGDCAPSNALHWADCGNCEDLDRDGRGVACDLGEDCGDNDPDQWSTCDACTDADGDDHFTGCDAYVNRPGPDCDDADPDNYLRCDYCMDLDADGRFANCDRYAANPGPDCDDDDPNNWSSCGLCRDMDGDTYAANCDAYTGDLKGPDCNDSNSLHWSDCATCTDSDADGRGTGCDLGADCSDSDRDVWVSCATCADSDLDNRWAGCDSYFNHLGPDCDDGDGNSWSSCGTCVDYDTDGEWFGCDTYSIQKPGPDCNDLDVNNYDSCATCRDNDTDTYYVGCDAYVTIAGPDCGDTDVNNWASCTSCVDTDGDGRYAGCDSYTTIASDCDDTDDRHWADCGLCTDNDNDGRGTNCDLGDDCNDNSDIHWSDCATCFDVDLDMWGTGTCDVNTGDCDDNDNTRNPGATDDTVNGVDENCNGIDGPGFFDTFDDGVFAPQWTSFLGDTTVTTAYARSGLYSLNVGGAIGQVESTFFSTAACTTVAWRAYIKRGYEAPDSGENLVLEYWTGTSWVLASSWTGNSSEDPTFLAYTGTISAAAALHPQFRVRFRTTGGSGSCCDDYYIDDFSVGCNTDSDTDGVIDPFDCAPADIDHWDDCAVCVDTDGDDYGASCNLGPDCDDLDAGINPEADDSTVDTIDQNCDGYDGPVFTQTYSSSATLPIADASGNATTCGALGANSSAIVIDDAGTLFDVDVTINITHAVANHLDVFLGYSDGVNPATCVRLTDDNPLSSGANYTNTVLDDEAATAITAAAAPFSGAFRPETPLTALDGQPLTGTYTLYINDDTALTSGTLTGWGMTIRYY